MNKSVLVAVALSVAGCFVSQAAGPVSSVNAVGYISSTVTGGQYLMMANPFAKVSGSGSMTIKDVFGTNGIPFGMSVYLFDGVGYVGETFAGSFGWLPGTNDISRVDGFWVYSSLTTNLTLSGEVPGGSYASNTVSVLAQGYQMIGYPYPVSIALTNTALASVASFGDTIYAFNGVGYDGCTYAGPSFGWLPAGFTFSPGVGYWYYKTSAGSTNWNEAKPYNWP